MLAVRPCSKSVCAGGEETVVVVVVVVRGDLSVVLAGLTIN